MERFIVTFPGDYDDGPLVMGITAESAIFLADAIREHFEILSKNEKELNQALKAFEVDFGGNPWHKKFKKKKDGENAYEKWMEGQTEVYAKYPTFPLKINGVAISQYWFHVTNNRPYHPPQIQTVDEWFNQWITK